MSFLADLFGGKSGQKAANEAAAAQRASTQQAYAGARQQSGQGYDTADSILSGYEQPGKQAYSLYGDAIGLGGADGYGRAKAIFDADPFTAGEQAYVDRQNKAQFNRYNAQGMGNSGANRAASALANATRYGQRVEDFRNRLMGMGQQGAQFGMQRAGNAVDRGNTFAGYDIAEHTGYGNIEANRISQVQAAKTQGQNNLMKGIGTLAGLAAAPMTGGTSLIGMGANKLMAGMGGGGTPVGWQTTMYRG